MSDVQFVKPKRWEGRSFAFKMRFLAANYPEFALAAVVVFGISPLIALYRTRNFEGGQIDALKKYKATYVVMRDDHPNIEKVKAEKEVGRQYFPKY